MTPADFTAWQSRMGWNNTQTARAIYRGHNTDQIRGFHAGNRKIPKRVEYLCLMIEAVAKEDDVAMARMVREVRGSIDAAGPSYTRGGDRKSAKFREAACG